MNDQEFLIWLHEQLTEKYGWDQLVGHLHTLRAIIYNTPPGHVSRQELALNDLEELRGAIVRKNKE